MTNTGKRAGEDVPQFYARPPGGGRAYRLAGWTKLKLEPGQTQRVTIVAEPRTLARWDLKARGWTRDAGSYAVVVGHSAEDRALAGTVVLDAGSRP